ncbi:hypothetical protein ACSMFR_00630 [Listeria aquatica]|uniref:hypothetical protein n=1 Tax=Listeria aquatica TaxID=1494960 RepID=UPI003F7134B4
MSFGKLWKQQMKKSKLFVPLYISLAILVILYSFSFIPIYLDADNFSSAFESIFNRFLLFIVYFNVCIIANLSVLHFQIHDIPFTQSRKIWLKQACLQTFLINLFIWLSWLFSTILSFVFSNQFSVLTSFITSFILKSLTLFLSQLVLASLCVLLYFLFRSKLFTFIIAFIFNIICFALSLKQLPSVIYEYIGKKYLLQEIATLFITAGFMVSILLCAYVILMKKDIL